jgi:hypothetical protein
VAEAPQFNPQGDARDRDKALLAAIALLSVADIAAAVERWNRLAPKPYRDLLLATVNRGKAGAFYYDPAHLAFGIGGRGLIDQGALRQAIDAYRAASAREFEGLGGQVAAGMIAVSVWQDLMTLAIKQHQSVFVGLGAGGVENVDVTDLRIGSTAVRVQLERLDAFAGQIVEGKQTANTVEKVARRAGTYAEAAGTTYEDVRRNTAEDHFDEERRMLRPADHCPTCLAQAALGWQPIGTLKRIGDSECLWNCQCYFTYRRSP